MKKLLLVFIIGCSLAACNNESESSEPKETEAPDSVVTADSAAMMMDPANIIQLQDSLNRRPHQ